MSASLLLWGYQAQALYLALGMILLVEGIRLTHNRWAFQDSDFNRVTDICSLLLIGLLIYFVFNEPLETVLMLVMKWVPLVVFPIFLCQHYSNRDSIDIRAFFLTLRTTKADTVKFPKIHLSYPYAICCLISAGTANFRSQTYYLGLFLICGWALFSLRSKRFAAILWLALFFMAGFMGYLSHMGLNHLQLVVTEFATDWFIDLMENNTNPLRAMTAIGDIGKLKRSDKILFRIRHAEGQIRPTYLFEAIYNQYRSTNWFAVKAPFDQILPLKNSHTWVLHSPWPHIKTRSLTLFTHLPGGLGVLPVPQYPLRIEHLPAETLHQNTLGTLRVEGNKAFAAYRVDDLISKHAYPGMTPSPKDLDLPEPIADDLMNFLTTQVLSKKPALWPPRFVRNQIVSFFRRNYTYSLDLSSIHDTKSPLLTFLTQVKKGHCEYFATATVLLLRAAGIPARYVSGYYTDEGSPFNDMMLVRKKHAHAWAIAYFEGKWHIVETTPPTIEPHSPSFLKGLKKIRDLFSFCRFYFLKYRLYDPEYKRFKQYAWVLLIPLCLIILRRLDFRQKIKRVSLRSKSKRQAIAQFIMADSPFQRLYALLVRMGFSRSPYETLQEWMNRIEPHLPRNVSRDMLRATLRLYYRYRFDPKGLNAQEQETLQHNVASLRQSLRGSAPSRSRHYK